MMIPSPLSTNRASSHVVIMLLPIRGQGLEMSCHHQAISMIRRPRLREAERHGGLSRRHEWRKNQRRNVTRSAVKDLPAASQIGRKRSVCSHTILTAYVRKDALFAGNETARRRNAATRLQHSFQACGDLKVGPPFRFLAGSRALIRVTTASIIWKGCRSGTSPPVSGSGRR